MHTSIDLGGRAAVITGGAGGIGSATGVAMGAAGARVLLVDIDEDRLAPAAEAVAATGAEVQTRVADVTSSTDVRGYVAAALDAFGTIDVFFNNAAIIGPIGTLAEYDEDAFDRIMAVNVRGVFLGLRHVLPVMLARRSGSIINTGSISSERGLPGTPAYNAAKHALNALTANARTDLHAKCPDVHVTLVTPGVVSTDFHRNALGGSPPLPPNVPSQSAAEVAAAIVAAIDHPAAEVYTNPALARTVLKYFQDVAAFERELS